MTQIDLARKVSRAQIVETWTTAHAGKIGARRRATIENESLSLHIVSSLRRIVDGGFLAPPSSAQAAAAATGETNTRLPCLPCFTLAVLRLRGFAFGRHHRGPTREKINRPVHSAQLARFTLGIANGAQAKASEGPSEISLTLTAHPLSSAAKGPLVHACIELIVGTRHSFRCVILHNFLALLGQLARECHVIANQCDLHREFLRVSRVEH